ncbi:MAG: hypothetical protein ACOY3J_07030 [Bacillota bacterium]|uniref:Uncharacterized protein n=1 Tax=Thermanaerosceptrum fracticalcis TaxID=1712410 RepID=A0A7G6DZ58_THEFR|nr:hypothetical protein [Thermanaerosceptrum fracticalcis]QNB45112.1 hypothetical protein BR63_01515 [Thermanaerosceptrum fracticalcis]
MVPMCVEQEYYVPYYTGEKRAILKNELWDRLRSEAVAEGISPADDWQTFWEERPIRYLPQQASLIRLGFYGPL